MKRVIGIFLSLSSLLTYLNLGIFFNPVVVKQSKIGMNSVVTTVKVTYQYPLMYWVIFYLLIITFILGIYFILAKEKKTKEYPLCDTLSVNGKMEPANNEKGMWLVTLTQFRLVQLQFFAVLLISIIFTGCGCIKLVTILRTGAYLEEG